MREFYFFGVGRGGKLARIGSPISVDEKKGRFYRFPGREGSNLLELIEEWISGKDEIIINGKKEHITRFLSQGELLSPEYQKKKVSIYFINKLILIKINREFETFSSFKNRIWKLIKPLKIISENEFKKIKCGSEDRFFFLEKSQKSIITAEEGASTFILIKSRDFRKTKNILKKLYENKSNQKTL